MAGQFTLRIEGLDEVVTGFRKAGANFEPVMQQAMRNSIYKLKNDVQENITNKGISNTGNLRRSVGEREITAYRGVVGVGEKYGGAVEFGRRPGKPPPADAIERWAQTKLGVSGVGFVIAQKIGKKGTKAQPFVEPAFRADGEYVVDQFKQAVEAVLSMMAGK